MRQAKREERRLRAAAYEEREECPMKAQAKAYMVARELERELDVDPEGSFFGTCCEDDDTITSQSPPTTTTELIFPKRRKGILRRRCSQAKESKKRSSSPSPSLLTDESITESLLEPSAEMSKKPKAAATVNFVPGDATDLVTGEGVPANQSGLSWRDWQTLNRSLAAWANIDAMRAAAEGCPVENGADEESESDYDNSTDEDDSSESDGDFEEDEDEDEEFAEFELGVKCEGKGGDDEDGGEEDYDERLSSNGTKEEDSEDWNPFESESDSDSDSSGYDDAEYESEDEEDGPEWEFC